jgi:hypothetical protein
MKQKWFFNRGDRLKTRDGTGTRWTYVKELAKNGYRRRVLVECDCGTIQVIYLQSALSGQSMGCFNCRTNHGYQMKPKEDSLRQQSLNVGMSKNYFCNMKRNHPEMFEYIKRRGNGRLDDGWFRICDELYPGGGEVVDLGKRSTFRAIKRLAEESVRGDAAQSEGRHAAVDAEGRMEPGAVRQDRAPKHRFDTKENE